MIKNWKFWTWIFITNVTSFGIGICVKSNIYWVLGSLSCGAVIGFCVAALLMSGKIEDKDMNKTLKAVNQK